MPEQVYDKGYKRLLTKKKNFLNLLQDFVKESWVNELEEDDLLLMNTQFILKDFSDKEADIIYHAKLKGQKIEVIFYCLLELQSKVDFTMPFRLLLYMVELMRRIFLDTDKKKRERKSFRLPIIIPIVLYNGDSEWTAVKSFKEYLQGYPYFGDRMIDFRYILLNVNHYTDDSLLEINSLLSSIFLLDKKQERKQLIEQFKKALHIFSTLSQDDQIEFKEWLYDIFKKKVDRKDTVEEFMNHLEKGDKEGMTYALERYFDNIFSEVEETSQKLKVVNRKLESANKQVESANKQVESANKQVAVAEKKEALANERAAQLEDELKRLRKEMANRT